MSVFDTYSVLLVRLPQGYDAGQHQHLSNSIAPAGSGKLTIPVTLISSCTNHTNSQKIVFETTYSFAKCKNKTGLSKWSHMHMKYQTLIQATF